MFLCQNARDKEGRDRKEPDRKVRGQRHPAPPSIQSHSIVYATLSSTKFSNGRFIGAWCDEGAGVVRTAFHVGMRFKKFSDGKAE